MLTDSERRARARKQDALIQSFAKRVRGAVAREKNLYVANCAASYRNTSHFRDSDFYAHEKNIQTILERAYLKIGRIIHTEVSLFIKADNPFYEKKGQSRFEYLLLEWAREEAARKAKPIAGTTRADLNRAVQKAFRAEAPEAVVIKEILAVRGFSNFRADAIARTETHNAAMYASLTTVEDYAATEEVTVKKLWSPTVDDRSREGHAEMENHPAIGMTELFDVPNKDGGTDKMDRPGDTSAPADQVINCRCVLTYEVQ